MCISSIWTEKDHELEQQSCKQLTKTFGSEHPAIVTIINRCVFAYQFAISIPVQSNYESLQLLLYLGSIKPWCLVAPPS